MAASGCTAGPHRFASPTRYRKGTVINVRPAANTALAPLAPVTLVLSTGKPCIVPRNTRGLTLTALRRKLTVAHCTLGKVRRVHVRRQAAPPLAKS